MRLSPTIPIGKAASRHPELISLFERLNLDFYNRGYLTVRDACANSGVDWDLVTREIRSTVCPAPRRSPRRGDSLLQLASANSQLRVALENLAEPLGELARDLVTHIAFEERVFMPYLKKLEQAQERHRPFPTLFGYTAHAVVPRLIGEHDRFARVLSEAENVPPDVITALHRHIHLMSNIVFPHILDVEADRNSACSFESRFATVRRRRSACAT